MVEELSIAEYHRQIALNKKPRSKYGNMRCELDGFKFDSKAERDYYSDLRHLELARLVHSIQVHPKWPIIFKGVHVCDVEMDFSFYDVKEHRSRVIDVKGHDNAMSRLKRKLFEAQTGITVEVVT